MPRSVVRRRRLALLAGSLAISALVWTAPRLRAQQETPVLSAEQAARSFMALLEFFSAPMLQIDSEWGNESDNLFVNFVSLNDRKLLGDNGARLLLRHLARQHNRPRWTATIETTPDDPKTVIAQVTPDTSPAPRAVPCVREENGWHVNLIATFTQWNELSDNEAKVRIYSITQVALPGMPVNHPVLRAQCQSHLKQLALGMMQYLQDYDEKFPPAKEWSYVTFPYIKSSAVQKCPAVTDPAPYGYALNWKLSRKFLRQIREPSTTAMDYETPHLKPSASGEGKDLAFRHDMNGEAGANYGFVDGHVKWYKQGAAVNFNLQRH